MANLRGLGVDERRAAADLHAFGDRADLQGHIDAGHLLIGQRQARKLMAFEALGLHREFVLADGQQVEGIAAVAARPDGDGEARAEVLGFNAGARDGAIRGIGDDAANGSGGLGEAQKREPGEEEQCPEQLNHESLFRKCTLSTVWNYLYYSFEKYVNPSEP